jgi:hypothetical protein
MYLVVKCIQPCDYALSDQESPLSIPLENLEVEPLLALFKDGSLYYLTFNQFGDIEYARLIADSLAPVEWDSKIPEEIKCVKLIRVPSSSIGPNRIRRLISENLPMRSYGDEPSVFINLSNVMDPFYMGPDGPLSAATGLPVYVDGPEIVEIPYSSEATSPELVISRDGLSAVVFDTDTDKQVGYFRGNCLLRTTYVRCLIYV